MTEKYYSHEYPWSERRAIPGEGPYYDHTVANAHCGMDCGNLLGDFQDDCGEFIADTPNGRTGICRRCWEKSGLSTDTINGCCGALHVENFGFQDGFDPQTVAELKKMWREDEAAEKRMAELYDDKYTPMSFSDWVKDYQTDEQERNDILYQLACIVSDSSHAFVSLILTDAQLEAYPKKKLKELGFKHVGRGLNHTGNYLNFFLRVKPSKAKNPSYSRFMKSVST